MIDINLYRLRIGTYTNRGRKMKSLRKYESTWEKSNSAGLQVLSGLNILFKICLLLVFISSQNLEKSEDCLQLPCYRITSSYTSPQLLAAVQLFTRSKNQTSNFKAKYMYGNKQAVKKKSRNREESSSNAISFPKYYNLRWT